MSHDHVLAGSYNSPLQCRPKQAFVKWRAELYDAVNANDHPHGHDHVLTGSCNSPLQFKPKQASEMEGGVIRRRQRQ